MSRRKKITLFMLLDITIPGIVSLLGAFLDPGFVTSLCKSNWRRYGAHTDFWVSWVHRKRHGFLMEVTTMHAKLRQAVYEWQQTAYAAHLKSTELPYEVVWVFGPSWPEEDVVDLLDALRKLDANGLFLAQLRIHNVTWKWDCYDIPFLTVVRRCIFEEVPDEVRQHAEMLLGTWRDPYDVSSGSDASSSLGLSEDKAEYYTEMVEEQNMDAATRAEFRAHLREEQYAIERYKYLCDFCRCILCTCTPELIARVRGFMDAGMSLSQAMAVGKAMR